MKTNLLQSQLHRNAAVITKLTKSMAEHKADAKAAQLEQSRRYHRAAVVKLRARVIRLAEIQQDIKRDLLAVKYARIQIRKKHGKDDARYLSWRAGHTDAELYVGQEGIGVAAPAFGLQAA